MTKFNRDQFNKGGEYIEYCMVPMPCPFEQRKFVARFKYAKGSKASFVSFLIKNFTVEEYFARLDAGEAPLLIVESKGYIQPHIKKWLREGGYPVTVEGKERYIRDQVATTVARLRAAGYPVKAAS